MIEPYVDAQSGALTMTIAKLLDDGESVIAMDAPMDRIQQIVEEAVADGDSDIEMILDEHMDVIADESAAIVDDVLEEARKDERVQKAEEFANDVNEIVDNTKQDIYDHFGPEEETEDLSEAVGLEEATEGI